MEYISNRLKEVSTWVGLVSVFAAVIMAFTPDHIDKVIEMLVPKLKEIIETIFTVFGAYKIVKPDTVGK
jgi:hypothetical protein